MDYKIIDWKVNIINFEEEDIPYLWDFGLFKMKGSENYPTSKSTSACFDISKKLDYEKVKESESIEKTVNLYFGDYTYYVETNFETAEYLLDLEEGSKYKILDRDISDKYGSKNLILLSRKSNRRKKDKVVTKTKEAKDLLPVLKI